MKQGEKLPGGQTLLSESKYHNEKIFLEFIEQCDETTTNEPEAGFELARHAPAFAEKVAPTVKRPEPLFVAAYSVLGTAHRAIGDHAQAESTYDQAEEHGQSLSELELLDLKRRRAYLRLAQGHQDEALELIDTTIITYRIHGNLSKRDFLGRCHLARGEINRHRGNPPQAVLDYATALTHLDLKQSGFYVDAALHNLMIALVMCPNVDALRQATSILKQAEKRTYYKGDRLAKYRLKWTKALISLRFGATRQAIRFLTTARDGLTKLGAAHDFILISLDLNDAYFMEARPSWEVQALATETYDLASSMSANQEALKALTQWRDAAAEEQLTDQVMREVRERVVAVRGRS